MKKSIPSAFLWSLLLVIGIGVAIYKYFDLQNQRYASDYFSFMPVEKSLESRKWHFETLACTYAVVSITEDAPHEPPAQWLENITWSEAPLKFKESVGSHDCRNLICECQQNWQESNYGKLNRALSQPGSYYYLTGQTAPYDRIGQAVLFIYSKPERIAARVRYGD